MTNLAIDWAIDMKASQPEILKQAIDESVASQDEVVLPGLGVFLELIWENADMELKDQLIEIIKKRVSVKAEKENTNN